MPRRFIIWATVLLGILPATLELLVVVLISRMPVPVPEGVVVVVDWASVPRWFVEVSGTLVGYVALFFALKGVGRGVAIALFFGSVTMVSSIVSGAGSYMLVPPAVVALAHSVGYFVGRRRQAGGRGVRSAV